MVVRRGYVFSLYQTAVRYPRTLSSSGLDATAAAAAVFVRDASAIDSNCRRSLSSRFVDRKPPSRLGGIADSGDSSNSQSSVMLRNIQLAVNVLQLAASES